jgi:hypothetical protein
MNSSKCRHTHEFPGDGIAICEREPGHAGMHVGKLGDGDVVQWANAAASSELTQPRQPDDVIEYERSDLAAFEYVLPAHGARIEVLFADDRVRSLLAYDTALIIDGRIEAITGHDDEGRRYTYRWAALRGIIEREARESDESAAAGTD